MEDTKNTPRIRKFFYQFEGIATLRDGRYISEWNQYISELAKTPRNPNLWCNRALICLKEGYPKIALMDAKRVLLLCDESKDSIELQKLSYKGRYYYAEALLSPNGISTKLTNEIGQYPWDHRPSERISATVIKELQDRLDIASNKKLKIVLRKLQPDLVLESKVTIHLGIEANQDLLFHEHILEEDPFIAGHNHFSDRCEYCTLELVETPGHPRCAVKYPCHNNQCKELFCSKKCYKLAMKLYHSILCGKNINTIIRSAQRDHPGWNQSFILVLKLFALAKKRNINPLDIKEIKYLSCQYASPFYCEGHLPWDAEYEIIYFEILKLLEISLYDIKYDFWIFITLMTILAANVFNGEGNSRNTLGIFPLTSLFNHSCDPLITHMDATERYITNDLIEEYMKIRKKYEQIACNPFRFTIITLQHVKKRQEIFISYVDSTDDKQERHTRTLSNYGFICRCCKCEASPQSFINPSVC
ncbi:hypothetical protein C1645_812785 [Glomus cerebriforme]|uniref:Histone-lysine N-methyltransferase SET5 n=1 Tax=Glomus cerebriforme TaxID=658196 RepID=A0A397TTZ4_9GLOM|nr:hypothetical protein C1645_812785 [Glomus cerebriforme]